MKRGVIIGLAMIFLGSVDAEARSGFRGTGNKRISTGTATSNNGIRNQRNRWYRHRRFRGSPLGLTGGFGRYVRRARPHRRNAFWNRNRAKHQYRPRYIIRKQRARHAIKRWREKSKSRSLWYVRHNGRGTTPHSFTPKATRRSYTPRDMSSLRIAAKRELVRLRQREGRFSIFTGSGKGKGKGLKNLWRNSLKKSQPRLSSDPGIRSLQLAVRRIPPKGKTSTVKLKEGWDFRDRF